MKKVLTAKKLIGRLTHTKEKGESITNFVSGPVLVELIRDLDPYTIIIEFAGHINDPDYGSEIYMKLAKLEPHTEEDLKTGAYEKHYRYRTIRFKWGAGGKLIENYKSRWK